MTEAVRRVCRMVTSLSKASNVSQSTILSLEKTIPAVLTYMNIVIAVKKTEREFNQRFNKDPQLQIAGSHDIQFASMTQRRKRGAAKAHSSDTPSSAASISATAIALRPKKRKTSLPQEASDCLIEW